MSAPVNSGWTALSDVLAQPKSYRCKSGRVKIRKDGWLVISPPNGYGADRYEIEPHRIDTFAKCFEWCFHFSCKTWMTPEMEYDLVILLGENLEHKNGVEWPNA